MPITHDAIRRAILRSSGYAKGARDLNDALNARMQTAFLCHSHKDRALATGLAALLREAGWRVYIDWQDDEMPETPDRTTAAKIKMKIISLEFFLFLATENSMRSRWCPWEIGYADGKKALDKLFVIPTRDDAGRYHGNEYLQLYRRIDEATSGGLAAWEPGSSSSGVYLRNF